MSHRNNSCTELRSYNLNNLGIERTLCLQVEDGITYLITPTVMRESSNGTIHGCIVSAIDLNGEEHEITTRPVGHWRIKGIVELGALFNLQYRRVPEAASSRMPIAHLYLLNP